MTGWRQLGSDVMLDARKALGLSAETMGRKLNVSSKTWERWEKAGRVPEPMVEKVAETLNLEIVANESRRVVLSVASPESELQDLRGEVAELKSLLGEVLTRLPPPPPEPQSARRRNG